MNKPAAIGKALFDEPQATENADGPAREELAGTAGLLHPGQATTFFSARGAGKTTAALVLALSHAAEGGRTYYFDRENGAALTLARVTGIVEAHDWPDALQDGTFIGRHYPQLLRAWEPEDFGEAFAARGVTLVIYDSLREAISQLGGDPNSAADISRFVDLAVTPLVRRGIAVLILDNTGHENQNRPAGSGAKLDAIPQAHQVEMKEPFSPAQLGRIEITCTRSRFGDASRRWTMRVGNGTFELPRPQDEAPDATAARARREKREALRRACIEALRDETPLSRDALLAAARKRGIKGRNTALRTLLAELAADPDSGLVQEGDGWALEVGPGQKGQPPLAPERGANPGPTPDTEAAQAAAVSPIPHGPGGRGQPGANPPEAPMAPAPPPLTGGGPGGQAGLNGTLEEALNDPLTAEEVRASVDGGWLDPAPLRDEEEEA